MAPPRPLATCLLPFNELVLAIVKPPTALLPPRPGLLLENQTAAAPSRAPSKSARSTASAAPSGSIPTAVSTRRSATHNTTSFGRGHASSTASPEQPATQTQPQAPSTGAPRC